VFDDFFVGAVISLAWCAAGINHLLTHSFADGPISPATLKIGAMEMIEDFICEVIHLQV
jgi:hypothetical protein